MEQWQRAQGKSLIRAFCRKLLVSMLWDARCLDADFAASIRYLSPTFILGVCIYILGENTSFPFKTHVILARNGQDISGWITSRWILRILKGTSNDAQKQLYICKGEYKGKLLYLLTNSQSKMTISMNTFLKKIKTKSRSSNDCEEGFSQNNAAKKSPTQVRRQISCMILNQRGSVNSHVKRQDIHYPYRNIPGNICNIS